MSTTRLLAVLAAAAVAGFAPAPFPRPGRHSTDDQGNLQGYWKLVRYESSGRALDKNYWVKVEKDTWTFYRDARGVQRSASYGLTLGPKDSPPSFGWTMTGRRGGGVRPTWVGSYRREGKRLTLVFSSAGRAGGRPVDFKASKDYLMVLEWERP
jgi:uncharacterized protein (TIGR03067 family)